MKNVFVTGAGGFIGRHLVADLLSKDMTVVALMMPGETEPPQFAGKVRTVVGDVRDLQSIAEDIGEFDTMFHLAAIVSDWGSKQSHVDITVKGTEQAIELALQQQAKFIVTTSVAAFASALGHGEVNEQTSVGTPSSSYEYVKQLQEEVTLKAVSERGLNAIIIRPANVYGVGSIWVTRYIELLSEQKPVLMGKGDWDAGLVHVSNLVNAMLLAGENTKLAPGEIFIISDNAGVTWQDYVSALSTTLDLPKGKSIPNILAKILAPVLEGVGKMINQKNPPVVTNLAFRLTGAETVYINSKAKDLLGFEPSITLDQAMSEIKAHYK